MTEISNKILFICFYKSEADVSTKLAPTFDQIKRKGYGRSH